MFHHFWFVAIVGGFPGFITFVIQDHVPRLTIIGGLNFGKSSYGIFPYREVIIIYGPDCYFVTARLTGK